MHDFSTLPIAACCYLLAMYLGDGSISHSRRVWRLRITLDQKYPAIIERCCQAIEILMPGQRAGIVKRIGCVDVSLFSKHWPCLLPQHGAGVKHKRRIALEPWQQALVDQATEEFVLGLIHSDGCRVVANDRGVASVRYHFSNRSEDIIGLFTTALDQLASTGRGQPSTSCPSTKSPIRPVWTSSSARKLARYRWKVSTTRRRRPALIVLAIAGAAGCLALAWWQWTRFESASGTFQNLGYALQWPLFAGFVVYAYYKFVRYEEAPPEPKRNDADTEIPAGLLPERPTAADQPNDDDPALREYNAYLADLAKKDHLKKDHLKKDKEQPTT